MREVRKVQMELGALRIEDIQTGPKSRDDIPALLQGLQYLYRKKERPREMFELLEKEFRPGVDLGVGRPGMAMWRVLVMGVLKQGLGCDFDRLHELVNEHRTIREFWGMG